MYNKVDTKLDFQSREQEMLEFWKKENVFKKLTKQNENGKLYSFYEGPPTANGKPHIGHVLTRTIKDLFLRFHSMKGENVVRKGGWDTHGLPVELEVEKNIGSTGKSDIEKYGVDKFIQNCKENVWIYKDMWEKMSDRMGYWVDMENPYITYSNNYIESVWWSLAELYNRGLIYKGHRILPYCPRCGTTLSSHEVAQGYKDVKEKSVFVKFQVVGKEKTYLLAWTTTPWTLPSNVALCVNANEDYVKIQFNDEMYIMAKELVNSLFKPEEYTLLETFKGQSLENVKYVPLFDYVASKYPNAYFVTCDNYVTLTDGTGIVHIAPAFGEDDAKVGKKYNLPFVQLVTDKGNLSDETGEFAGIFVKDADPKIIQNLKSRGLLLKEMLYEHSYPFCWRCKTPLLYYARSSWFVATTKMKEDLLKNNSGVDWKPETVGEGRMGGFLKNVIDWDIARPRYWGTPLPFWVCNKCGKIHAIGSVEELKKLGKIDASVELDLHKPTVDKITFECDCGGTYERTPEVLDCWYDSGSMPFAQLHYPFENKELFEKTFPSEFISEGMDQTRGWFYSLLAVNTLLFDKSPYKRCLPLGLVCDEFGKKMSKSIGNVVDPWKILGNQGADGVRWYFYTSSAPWLGTSFKEESLNDCQRKFMGTLWNTYAFFILYADIDKYDGSKYKINKVKLSLMDRWIISEFNSLVKYVDNKLENYISIDPSRKIVEFVDSLSNWYVRRSRERFWVSGETEDKTAAFTTLYYVLTNLAKLVAPFTPFIAESIYQNLVRSIDKSAPISVHLCKFPVADESLIYEHLNIGMENVLEAVVLGRSARNKSNIKNRQPLAEMFIASNRALDLNDELETLIKDELNVENLSFIDNAGEFLSYEIKPQLKTMGPKYGAMIGHIKNFLANVDGIKVYEAVQNGGIFSFEIENTKVEVTSTDLLITPISKEGYSAESNNGITVVLNTTISDELKEKGDVREFVSKLQAMRKEADFEVVNHIEIMFNGDKDVEQLLTKYSKEISRDVLADAIIKGEPKGFVKELDINGLNVFIGIKVIAK